MVRSSRFLSFLSIIHVTAVASSAQVCTSGECPATSTAGLTLLQSPALKVKPDPATFVATSHEDTKAQVAFPAPAFSHATKITSEPAALATTAPLAPSKQPELTTGNYEFSGLNMQVFVPEGEGPFPVLIGLHGRGGGTDKMVEAFGETPGHIVVVPNWTHLQRDPKSNTAKFIGTELVNCMANFTNVDPTSFKIGGYSAGGAMTHVIAIENDDPRITHIITFMSMPPAWRYHDGHFPWLDEEHTLKKETIQSRKFIMYAGMRDTTVYCCDSSKRSAGGYVMTWDETAYRYAQALGFDGSQKIPVEDYTSYSVNYLNDQVHAIALKTQTHAPPIDEWLAISPLFLGSVETPAETAPSSEAAETTPSSNDGTGKGKGKGGGTGEPAPPATTASPAANGKGKGKGKGGGTSEPAPPATPAETAPSSEAAETTPSPEAQECCAVLYEHPFSFDNGWEVKFTPGEYDMQAMEAAGADNDDASAIKVVGEGCRAELYEHPGFEGRKGVFTTGVYNYRDFVPKFPNDAQSGIKVISA